jgi:serine/alanine adding enzyme
MEIKIAAKSDEQAWDNFVMSHPNSNLYHLSGWKNVIERSYKHATYYFMAVNPENAIVGILPLVHLKHFLFGNNLISIPFFDMCGVLSNDEPTEKALFDEAIKLGHELKVDSIDLRYICSLSLLKKIDHKNSTTIYQCNNHDNLLAYETKDQKVRMILELPVTSDALMKSFNSKFRNKIKKPIKAGLKCKFGGIDLLDDFYNIFAINMRDLGSPVHSKRFIKNVLNEFPQKAKIGIVYKGKHPISCILVIGFKNVLANPWASALREYSNLRANTLQYWTMLEYACDNGYTSFDFGRSSPEEGTFKFKEKWGAKPTPLHWCTISMDGKAVDSAISKKSAFDNAIKIWQKMPVGFTKIIGPSVRKHISL